ncbi:cupin domain-containing protein [Nonomuraea sp. NPDC050663]|uniref:cupin domain-containing protein n=1 Tax=Nonomuraea sp. NPDC050663 TaxID=3364370 RepID=UPI0037AC95CA
MTYPDPKYFGDKGEITASFRPASQEPDLRYPHGGSAHYLATGASTGGLFGLYRWNMPATPTGPAPHFHRTMTESFFVLEGAVNIFNGEKWLECGPGDFVHVPIGGVHGFRNESGAPASMLIHFSPGAPREGYFEGLLEQQGPEFYAQHDNYWI